MFRGGAHGGGERGAPAVAAWSRPTSFCVRELGLGSHDGTEALGGRPRPQAILV